MHDAARIHPARAGIAFAAIVGLGGTLAVPLLASPAEAATQTLLSVNFDDSTIGGLWESDDPTVAFVADPADAANTVAQITDRTQSWFSLSTPNNVMAAGTVYAFSVRVRLADAEAAAAEVMLQDNVAYGVIDAEQVSGAEWTILAGTFTPSDGSTAVYINAPAGVDLLVDDFVVTYDDGVCLPTESVDFEGGGIAPWQANGATVTVVEDAVDASNHVAAVTGRGADTWRGIGSSTGAYEADVEYTFTAKVRLSAGASVRFVANEPGAANEYVWVGNTAGDAAEWTTVTGTHTFGAGADSAKVSLEVSTAQDYEVDDIVVTGTCGDGGGPGFEIPDGFVGGGALNPTTAPVSAAQGMGDVAALTFDDGPNGADTVALLDFLAENDLRATFCVIGQNIEAPGGADLLRRIVSDGHVLCNHSTGYADMGSWSEQQVADDLMENLEIIRDALGDPNAQVPFFRAPNGSWGKTPAVAVALGMQPLAVVNTIADWETQDVPTLETNLRAAIKPGQLVLAHDGGGDRAGTIAAVSTVVTERLGEGWTFTLPQGTPPASGKVILSTDFEDGLDGWAARNVGEGDHTVSTTDAHAHGGMYSALVAERVSQGSGLGYAITDELVPGAAYDFSAWVRFGEGQPTDDVVLSFARTVGETTSYDNLLTFTDVTSSGWTEVSGSFTPSAFDAGLLYFETAWSNGETGNTSDLYIDDIRIATAVPAVIEDLTPISDTTDFPVGVAIDSRETIGAAAELTLQHFDQVTPENYMKPEAWYSSTGEWSPNASEIGALMDFAQENGLNVYGHVLVWHSQTPAFFFDHQDGSPLTTSEADKQILRDRMRDHIFNVAEYLSDGWGEFGGGNPVVAFDVVNEVIDDSSAYADGMRRSEWYRILGEEFVDLAFEYAEEAFNGTYAAAGVDRPVTLFINDYNTEQSGKRARYLGLVDRLLERDVPVDGIGHQFHVSLAMPVAALEDAIEDASTRGLVQAVTELDVTTGVPESQARFIDQGYYYRDAFEVFREHQEELFSVTVWGLNDARSWRDANGGPLVFDDSLQAKPAYYGIVEPSGAEAPLPARQRTANVFAGSVPAANPGILSSTWSRLPLIDIDGVASAQMRWAEDHLTVYVTVEDSTPSEDDQVELQIGDHTWTISRVEGSEVAAVRNREGDYALVAHLPLTDAMAGDAVEFDLRVIDDGDVAGWNTPGVLGTLTLVEALSFTTVPEASAAPSIDGTVDAVWSKARAITTDKEVQGTDGAVGTFRLLWKGQTLYVLAEVADDQVDVSGSDPWIQDSVEIYVDPGNAKNGAYRYDDTQIRINADNVVSFGTGDEGFQANRVESSTVRVDGGYVVEAAISLLEYGGLGTFHGVDVQVNDAADGARQAITNWADPTGAGYQSTARWGVAELVRGAMPFSDVGPSIAHRGSVQWMWEQGLTHGWSDGTFRPRSGMTREQLAAFIYRLEAPEGYVAPVEPIFSDVTPSSTPFYTEISYLAERGITRGWPDGTFRPRGTANRDMVAAFLFRYVGAEAAASPSEAAFTDVPTSHVFATEIGYLADQGIARGWADGTFRPATPVAREEFAAFLERIVATS